METHDRRRLGRLALLVLLPIVLRVVLAFLVDDFEDDAWARDLIAQQLSREMRSGSLSLRSILNVSVWLPAWQLLCAAIECAIPAPYFVPKILSAVFGGVSPAVVFALSLHLARDAGSKEPHRAARIAWALAAFSPWHVLYSSIGMTEAFYGFWIVSAMYALVRARRDNRWLLIAALAVAPATWTRFEGWMLAASIPAIALLQRRARAATFVISCVLIAIPPLLWLALNRTVTGDAWHFARVGANDVQSFLAFRGTEWSDRGPFAIAYHIGYVLAVNGVIVSLLATYGLFRMRSSDAKALALSLLVLFGFLLALWLARRQVGWRRYYVPLGMPLCAAAGVALAGMSLRRMRRTLFAIGAEILIVTAVQAHFMVTWVVPRVSARREIAALLRTREGLTYADEPTVRMLSGLAPSRFVNQWELPHGRERGALLGAMRSRGVRWVVFVDADYSALPREFPWMRTFGVQPPFALMHTSRTSPRAKPGTRVALYEMTP